MSHPPGTTPTPAPPRRPFATLVRARNAVRQQVARGLTHDLLVLIHGGTYEQAETLTFGPETRQPTNINHLRDLSGRKGRRQRRAKDHRLEEGQGRDLDSRVAGGEGRQVVLPPTIRQRSTGGSARTPNVDEKKPYCTIQQSSLVPYLANGLPKSRDVFFKEITVKVDRPIRAWKNVSDVEFVWWNNNDGSRKRLDSVNEQDQTFTIPPPHQWPPLDFPGYYHIGYPLPQYPGYFENALEFLDQPGEWYLDRATGILHYWPRAGRT